MRRSDAADRVLNVFIKTYPDLFPGGNLAAYGVIYREGKDLAVGFSRRTVEHLGGQPSLGISCAACHTAEFQVDQSKVKAESAKGVT